MLDEPLTFEEMDGFHNHLFQAHWSLPIRIGDSTSDFALKIKSDLEEDFFKIVRRRVLDYWDRDYPQHLTPAHLSIALLYAELTPSMYCTPPGGWCHYNVIFQVS